MSSLSSCPRRHGLWCTFLPLTMRHNWKARIASPPRRPSTMKRLVPGFALCLILSFNIATTAQDKQTPADDSSAVRATVTNYIEAYYTGDARRMEQKLHPHYLKHMIHGDIPMREKTGSQMVQEVRSHGVPDIPHVDRKEQVS